jgi:hypothetical protein
MIITLPARHLIVLPDGEDAKEDEGQKTAGEITPRQVANFKKSRLVIERIMRKL